MRALLYLGTGTAAVLVLACAGGMVLVLGLLFAGDREGSETPRLEADLNGLVRKQQGALVAGARVVLVYTCDSDYSHDKEIEVSSDSKGVFHIERPYAHPALLFAFAGDAVSEPLALDLQVNQAPAPIELCLLPEGRISGQLLDGEGRPLGDREIWIDTSAHQGWTVKTDAQGRYEFGGLPQGRARLSVEPTDEEVAAVAGAESWHMRRELYVDVVSGQTIEARIPPRVQLHARIFLGETPQHGMLVAARKENGAITVYVDCEKDGSQDFPAFLGPGLYQLTTEIRLGEGWVPWKTAVEVPDAPTFDYDLRIPVGHIEGFVCASDGQPVAGAKLYWLPDDGADHSSSWELTSASPEGHFFVIVPAQGMRICATFGSRRSSWIEVQVQPDAVHPLELELASD